MATTDETADQVAKAELALEAAKRIPAITTDPARTSQSSSFWRLIPVAPAT